MQYIEIPELQEKVVLPSLGHTSLFSLKEHVRSVWCLVMFMMVGNLEVFGPTKSENQLTNTFFHTRML